MAPSRLLAIETSCDDTAAAVLVDGAVASSVLSSQDIHRAFGGVVPELASRDHQRLIGPVVRQALSDASLSMDALEGIAVTYGPGLAGSLLVGLSYAKGLAWALDVPLIGINHLEGHVYSLFADEPPPLPMVVLIVSGGHTQLVVLDEGHGIRTLGRTRDDAAGEAFDKVAKLMGLPYPGGPEIDRRASDGNPEFATFPRTFLKGFDFSFSGIKTSVLYHLNDQDDREHYVNRHMDDLCASFQAAVVEMLASKTARAVRETGIRSVGVAGGVSANTGLRRALENKARSDGWMLQFPPPGLRTDNAAMIGIAAHYKMHAGQRSPLTLTAEPALAL